jgi:hypothetical protein
MKAILSAAALLVAISVPALAEEATSTMSPAPAAAVVPAATEPATGATPAVLEGAGPSKASMGGCGSKETVYLTN